MGAYIKLLQTRFKNIKVNSNVSKKGLGEGFVKAILKHCQCINVQVEESKAPQLW